MALLCKPILVFHCNYFSISYIVSDIFSVKLWRDLEMWVRPSPRGGSKLLKMVPFESFGTVFFSHSIVAMTLSYIISEIKQNSGRKSLFLIHHFHSTPSLNMSLKFSPSDSHIILVFPYHTVRQYSDGHSANGGVECRWWGRWFSGNIWLHHVLWTVRLPSAVHSAATNRGELLTLVAGKRQSLFLTGDDDEVFMTRSQPTLRRRKQNSI